MAAGQFFSSEATPQVMVRVGNAGNVGVITISHMLFTLQGSTVGCILMEWNLKEDTQGSAATWDSYSRIDCLPEVDYQRNANITIPATYATATTVVTSTTGGVPVTNTSEVTLQTTSLSNFTTVDSSGQTTIETSSYTIPIA